MTIATQSDAAIKRKRLWFEALQKITEKLLHSCNELNIKHNPRLEIALF